MTKFDTSCLVTGAFILYKRPLDPISDIISFGEIARKDGFWRGLFGCMSNDVPSHIDVCLVKDNGLIETRGMSWPADPQGRYYYECELTPDDCRHIVCVAVWPELIKHPELQEAVAQWLRGENKMDYQYGLENLLRDLENKPTDPKKPDCAMFANFLLEYYSYLSTAPMLDNLKLMPFEVPREWVQKNGMGCDDQMQWFKTQGWVIFPA